MSDLRIPYKKKLLEYAKFNRKNPTFAERRLWKYIKGKALGVDFNRQKPLLNFIADFYCITLKLIIEIDGSSHDDKKFDYDIYRQRELESIGISFLRFTEFEVLDDIDSVLQTISNKIQELQNTSLCPPLERGGEKQTRVLIA